MDGQFDMVVAAYLLNYARDRAELTAMCCGIARALKPGGRFVTVNCNPALDFRMAPSYRKYGFETSLSDGFREGSPITWTFHLEDGPFSIENYYLDVPIHEQTFPPAWGMFAGTVHDFRRSARTKAALAIGMIFWRILRPRSSSAGDNAADRWPIAKRSPG